MLDKDTLESRLNDLDKTALMGFDELLPEDVRETAIECMDRLYWAQMEDIREYGHDYGRTRAWIKEQLDIGKQEAMDAIEALNRIGFVYTRRHPPFFIVPEVILTPHAIDSYEMYKTFKPYRED